VQDQSRSSFFDTGSKRRIVYARPGTACSSPAGTKTLSHWAGNPARNAGKQLASMVMRFMRGVTSSTRSVVTWKSL
jgi:hypothetical protein